MNASMNLSKKCLSKVYRPLAASNKEINYLKLGFFKEKRANKTEDKNSYESYFKNNVKGKIKVIETRYDAQSAFIVNSLGKIKNLWMVVFIWNFDLECFDYFLLIF